MFKKINWRLNLACSIISGGVVFLLAWLIGNPGIILGSIATAIACFVVLGLYDATS